MQFLQLNTAARAVSLVLTSVSLLLAAGTLATAPFGLAGAASGVAAAVTSAVVGGLLVALLARTRFEITTPTASMSVIYGALCGQLVHLHGNRTAAVLASLSLAVVLMGALLWLAGRMRVGDAIRFLPAPVSAGFVSGIGLIIMLSQAGPLLGLDNKLQLTALPQLLHLVRPGAVLVAAVTIATMMLHTRWKLPVPSNLAGVLAGTLAHHAIAAADPQLLGPTLAALQPAVEQVHSWQHATSGLDALVAASTLVTVLPFSAYMALQAVMNGAVVASAVEADAEAPPDVNRTLRAQGLANIVCGMLAGLPVCTTAPVSLAAARLHAPHSAVLLVFPLLFVLVFVAGDLLAWLPVAALAGTLVVTGFGLIDKWARHLARTAFRTRGRDHQVSLNLGLVVAVAGSFLVGSVPMALLVGSVLAMALLAVNLSRTTRLTVQDGTRRASTRVWPIEESLWLAPRRCRIAIVQPRGGLFFGTAEQLARSLQSVPAGHAYCIVDTNRLSTLDATGCQSLAANARRLQRRGTCVLLAGLDPAGEEARAMIALGLDAPDSATRWFTDVDRALEWTEFEMLNREGHGTGEAPVPLARTPLGCGMDAAALEQLRALLVRREAAPGVLFRTGEPAESLFVVERGRVDIEVHNPQAGRTTRLAGFGAGGIFGEVALLGTGTRSADAHCVEPTVLLELTRAALAALERESPPLHAHVLRNLGIHLADRLVIATATLQAQQ